MIRSSRASLGTPYASTCSFSFLRQPPISPNPDHEILYFDDEVYDSNIFPDGFIFAPHQPLGKGNRYFAPPPCSLLFLFFKRKLSLTQQRFRTIAIKVTKTTKPLSHESHETAMCTGPSAPPHYEKAHRDVPQGTPHGLPTTAPVSYFRPLERLIKGRIPKVGFLVSVDGTCKKKLPIHLGLPTTGGRRPRQPSPLPLPSYGMNRPNLGRPLTIPGENVSMLTTGAMKV